MKRNRNREREKGYYEGGKREDETDEVIIAIWSQNVMECTNVKMYILRTNVTSYGYSLFGED